MKSKELIKLATQHGFKYLRNGKGSHLIYVRENQKITIPMQRKSLNYGLTKSIIKQIEAKGTNEGQTS